MVAARAGGSVKIRLPAASPVLLLPGEGLLDLLAARLAAVERTLEQAREEGEEREEDDEDEAGGGDDLVVRLTPPALASVVGQRGGREHQQGHQGGGHGSEQTLHRLPHRIERGRHRGGLRRWRPGVPEKTPLDRVRELCLSLPETSERLSHGQPSFFIREKKTFVMYLDDHHGDGRLALWLAAAEGMQQALVEAAPEHYFRPPYVGHRGWLGVRLDRDLAWDEIAGAIEDAYLTVAPRSLVEASGLAGGESAG